MAVINGSSLLIYVGGVAVAHTTSATLNLDMATIDISSKSSGGAQEVLGGQKSATLDFEALTDFASSGYGMDDLFSLWYNRTSITWSLASGATSTTAPYFSGSGYITSLSLDAPMEDVSTFSGTITITGNVGYTGS